MTAHQRSRQTPRLAWLHRLWSLSTGRFGVVVVLVIGLTALLARLGRPSTRRRWTSRIGGMPPASPTCSAPTARGRDILSLLMAGARTTVWAAPARPRRHTLGLAAALGALDAPGARIRRGARRHPDRVPRAPHRDDAVVGGRVGWSSSSRSASASVSTSRVTRPELRRVLHSDFVTAGRASGLTPWQNLWRHLLPNVAPVFIVQASWGMAVAVLAEAGLSYPDSAHRRPSELGPAEGPADLHLGASALRRLAGLRDHRHGARLNLLGDGLREATDPDPLAAPLQRRGASTGGDRMSLEVRGHRRDRRTSRRRRCPSTCPMARGSASSASPAPESR